jgi:hypothetical protein
LTFKINTSPIPEIAPMQAAELNVHQLVHALEVARETMAQNEQRIAEQDKRIAELEALIRGDKGPIVTDEGQAPSSSEYMGYNKSSYV